MQMRKHMTRGRGPGFRAVALTLVAGLAVGGMSMAPAAAQGLAGGMAPLAVHGSAPTTVQGRPPGGGYHPHGRPPGWNRPHARPPGWHRPPAPPYHARWGRPYWHNNGWYYRNNSGAWVAAGIAGVALGAAAAAAAQDANRADAVAYCAQRYRSYDPRTGTYLGYDGYRHPCP